jgi:RNA polymerase sigma-70 factor, ECF subfamily
MSGRRLGTAIPSRCPVVSKNYLERGLFFRPKVQLESFEAVAMPHLTDLYRTACLLLRDRHEAEDLIQDTYLEAWKSFHRFEMGTNCRAWLFKIMFHRLHHVRRRLVKTSRVVTIDDPDGQVELAAEPVVPQEIRDEDVLNALAKVAVEFRDIVLLADVEEFSYKEIAETLRIPLGTVMSRLSRGRKLLRQELAEVARSYGIDPRPKQAGAAETA